jgi:hypothetical protein
VWNWRGRNGDGGKTALADWEKVALNDRIVYIAFDSDAMVKVEVHGALERLAAFLASRGAGIRIIYLPALGGGAKCGLDDFLAAGHTVDNLLAHASDKLRRPPGDAPEVEDKQYPKVAGSELLEDLSDFIGRFVVLPGDEVADLIALWVLHTWAFEAAFATPYLRVTSAAPASGKSLLFEVLDRLTRRGWYAVNPSTAVLYRKIDQQAPTLLLDEMDNYPIGDRRDALSVLNAGYKRGARVDRCKDDGTLESFSCFCPKAYAGLDNGSIADTLLSRSITVRLERKTGGEQVEMWITPRTEPQAQPLRDRCEAWAHHTSTRCGTCTRSCPPAW